MLKLTGVSETGLMTLYFRNLETQKLDAIIRDKKAVELVKRLDYDFAKFDGDWKYQIAVAIRTKVIDRAVQKFLEKTPNAIIVNLGAGIHLIAQWYLSDLHHDRQGWLKFLGYIPFFRQQAKVGYFILKPNSYPSHDC